MIQRTPAASTFTGSYATESSPVFTEYPKSIEDNSRAPMDELFSGAGASNKGILSALLT